MAIVVTHKQQGGRFVVLGANYTKWKTARGSAVFGDLFPVEKEGADRVLTVCGADGVIQFGDADEFVVLTIDGQSPEQLLGSDGTSPA
jgi:hypothetical protein